MVTRVSVRDRTWTRFRTARAAGPLDVPEADVVRARLRALAARCPDHPMLQRLAGARLTPAPLDALLEDVVVHEPRDLDADGLVAALVRDPDEHLPFRLVLAPHAAGMDVAHVLADGATANAWFRWLLGDDGVRPDEPAVRLPLLRAGARLARRPARALRAVRRCFPLAGPAPDPARPVAPVRLLTSR